MYRPRKQTAILWNCSTVRLALRAFRMHLNAFVGPLLLRGPKRIPSAYVLERVLLTKNVHKHKQNISIVKRQQCEPDQYTTQIVFKSIRK